MFYWNALTDTGMSETLVAWLWYNNLNKCEFAKREQEGLKMIELEVPASISRVRIPIFHYLNQKTQMKCLRC